MEKPLWNPDVVRMELLNDSWLNPNGNEVEASVQLDNELGELEVVIMRKNPGPTVGHGQIASLMIITEDIIFLQDTDTDFSIENVKLVDENLVEYPVAGSLTTVTIQAQPMALQSGQENDSGEEPLVDEGNPQRFLAGLNSNDEELADQKFKRIPFNGQRKNVSGVTVYPNPVVGWLHAKTGIAEEEIVGLSIFTTNGQLVRQVRQAYSPTVEVDVSDLPNGNYVVQLETTAGRISRMINK